MLIDDNIYRTNGFRILGLDINSSNTIIDNRIAQIDYIKETKDIKNYEPLKGAFDKSRIELLLPLRPEPSYNEYQTAKNRLYDVERRLIDELFWIWPERFDEKLSQKLVTYLKDNKINQAIRYWKNIQETSYKNMTATHNLAVLYHIRALDGFYEGKGNKNLFHDLEQSHNYWSQLVNSNDFRNIVKERVNSLNDPRLNEELVDKVFNDLPENLLNINYIYIKKYLNSERLGKRKQDYIYKYIENIRNSPFDKSLIGRFSSKIIDSIDKRITEHREVFEKNVEHVINQERKHQLIFEYHDSILPYLEILHVSFRDDIISDMLLNDSCKFIYYKIPTASNISSFQESDKPRYNKFMEILEFSSECTSNSKLLEKINTDLNTLKASQPNEYAVEINVFDYNGTSLSDARVTLTNMETDKSYNTTTDSSGFCRIDDLTPGKYYYKVCKEGYDSDNGTRKFDKDSNLKINLKKEKPATIDVFKIEISSDEDNVLSDVKISLTNLDTDKSYSSSTNLSGFCKLKNLPIGRYKYNAYKNGYEKDNGTINIEKDSNLKINLKKRTPLGIDVFRIEVTDNEDCALADVEVNLINLVTNKSYKSTTDSSGCCKVKNLPIGRYIYKAYKKGYESGYGTRNLKKYRSLKINLKKDNPNRTGFNFDIQVSSDDGVLEDVEVSLTNRDTNKSYTSTTDSSGLCKIRDLPSGKYSYKLCKEGYDSYDGRINLSEDVNLRINLEDNSSLQSFNNQTTESKTRQYYILIVAIILASLAYYAITNLP